MILGNGFIPMFISGMQWTGATWAVSGGNAYNTPTLGGNIVTNGNFESWTGGAPNGWIVNSENGTTRTVTEVSGAARFISDGSENLYISQLSTDNIWYQINIDVSAVTPYLIYGFTSNIGFTTSNGPVIEIIRSIGSTIYIGNSAAFDATIDNVFYRPVASPSTFVTVTGSSSTQTAAAKIATLTTDTQAGIVSLLDSPSNPQNFLIAYHDGTDVRLDKCVAGVYTNLITVAIGFVSNAQIEIRRPTGNSFELWYNGIQRGTTQTVNDAGIINNTRYGLFSTFNSNTFSEFTLGGIIIPFNLPGV